jgi:hypothetical protein
MLQIRHDYGLSSSSAATNLADGYSSNNTLAPVFITLGEPKDHGNTTEEVVP